MDDKEPTATRVRYQVLGFACSLSMITYLDRASFASAAGSMAGDLGLDPSTQLKWAHTAFTIAYGIFEVPAGWLGDRWGPRGTLLRIVTWWSFWTAITGCVGATIGSYMLGGLTTLIVVRFLFGAGEAGAYPNITRAIHNWFPRDFWESAQGLVFMSGRLAGGLMPLLWGVLVQGTTITPALHWRAVFCLLGLIGLAWCLTFAKLFRNCPQEHPGVNQSELALIGPLSESGSHSGRFPWKEILTHPSLWILCGMYSLINYGWIFNLTYLPGYIQTRFHLPEGDLTGSLYKGAPLWVGAAGCVLGGVLISGLTRYTLHRHRSRQIVGVCAMLLCAVAWWQARGATNALQFSLLVSLGAFGVDLTLGAAWAACQDIGRQHAAVTAACMNMIGAGGAAFASWHTGTIVQRSVETTAAAQSLTFETLPQQAKEMATLAGFSEAFTMYAMVYVVAAVCWFFIRVDRPLVRDS